MSSIKNVGSGFNRSIINDNFALLEDKLEQEVLKRNNTVSGQNTMDVDFDMNSNRILNLPAPTNLTEPVRLQEIQDLGQGDVIINNTFNDNSTNVPVLEVRTINSGYTIQATDNNVLYRCVNLTPIEIVVPFGLPSGNLTYFLQDTESRIDFRGITAAESGEDADYVLLSPLGYHPYTRNSIVCVTTITSGTGSLAGDLA